MSRIRFTIRKGSDVQITSWQDEVVRSGTVHTAVAAITKLREEHGPDAAIGIEREGDSRIPTPMPLFRYQVFVKDGMMPVTDEDGTAARKLTNATVTSRPFYEHEREKVLSEIRERFPDAQITEVKVDG